MPASEKPDSAEILATIKQLPAEPWMTGVQRSWPPSLYHFSGVKNVAGILQEGKLYCRSKALDRNVLREDSADREVISHSEWAHQYVRLYFGPRTPTQFYMEGIRPLNTRRNEAHCAIPVFLIFDSRKLLVRSDCSFSRGNVAREYSDIRTNAEFFRSLPFRDIYHRGVLPNNRKDTIKDARHAEVLFESELDLDALREVVCRTGPERDTLLSLLGRRLALVWKDRIRVEHDSEGLFERRWYYVRDIVLIGSEVHVEMSRAPTSINQKLLVKYEDGKQVTVYPPANSGKERGLPYS